VAESSTIIAALRFQGGVIIGADSQVSDTTALVRWPLEKLERVGAHPIVLGFSGSLGRAQKARANLEAARLHSSQFNKRELVRAVFDSTLAPIYKDITSKNHPGSNWPQLALWGLSAVWAGGGPHILEFEINGDSCFHDYFHAIGSASQTAYAIHRTLGGKLLSELDERKAVWAVLRILKTCVDVEVAGVNEPLSLWVFTAASKVRKLQIDEIQAELQGVDEWEQKERRSFFDS